MSGIRWYSLKCDDCGKEYGPKKAVELGVSNLRYEAKKLGWDADPEAYEVDVVDLCPKCKAKAKAKKYKKEKAGKTWMA